MDQNQTSSARRAFYGLSWKERARVAHVIVEQSLFHQALRVLPARQLCGVARSLAALRRAVPTPPRPLQDVVTQHTIAARLSPFPYECVADSLSLWIALRAQDLPATLQLGCRTALGKLEAHAWVDVDGVIQNDRGSDRTTWSAFETPLLRPID